MGRPEGAALPRRRRAICTRSGHQVCDSLAELAGLVNALDGHRVILDGELVACLEGTTSTPSPPGCCTPGAWLPGQPLSFRSPSWPSTCSTWTVKT